MSPVNAFNGIGKRNLSSTLREHGWVGFSLQ